MTALAPLFSRPVLVADLPPDGREVSIEASEAERSALAAAFDVPGIPALRATFAVTPLPDGSVRLSGEVEGLVEQVCVVTLDPLVSEVREAVDLVFKEGVEADPPMREDEELDDDPPEPIVNGRIDLGAAAAEHFSLGIDPYPRKPDATFVQPGGDKDDEPPSPFDKLKALKDRLS